MGLIESRCSYRLTLGQKLTMLRDVARALLDPTVPMPEANRR